MKILHIAPWYKPAYIYGGPIESISKLCESTAAAGHQVEVFTTTANGDEELEVAMGVNINGVTISYFKRITKDPTHISPSLWKHLRKNVGSYDIVHIHSWWNPLAIVACYICLQKKVKLVLSPRGMLAHYIFNSGSSTAKKLIHNTFGRTLLSKTRFHATSQAEFAECTELIKGWQGFVVPNILSLPDTALPAKSNEVFTIIYMSRIHPKKGLEGLFQALSGLKINFVLKIAGTGEERYVQKLKELANQLGINDKIIWLGWKDRSEKYLELASADLFVLVSANENFANVVIESLHMGTAVLISKGVALSDFVSEHNMGWVSSLDQADIRANIEDACNNQVKRMQIQNTGRQVIDDVFSEQKLVAAYITNYKQIINSALK